jgi:hypothetical protein
VKIKAVLRIRDILIGSRIRIRGSVPVTNGCGSGCGSCFDSGFCYFRQWPSRRQQKNFSITFWRYIFLHNFAKIKSHKEVAKQGGLRFFLLFLHDDRRFRIRIWIQEAQKLHRSNGSARSATLDIHSIYSLELCWEISVFDYLLIWKRGILTALSVHMVT